MRYARTTHKPQQRLSFSQVLHFFLQHILSSLESRDYQCMIYLETNQYQSQFNILGWISERKRQKVHSGLQIPGTVPNYCQSQCNSNFGYHQVVIFGLQQVRTTTVVGEVGNHECTKCENKVEEPVTRYLLRFKVKLYRQDHICVGGQ
ncbi:uncharacterized protein LOC113302741 [Papaver somniferum]|uniref:uncharacterized protein LOC113302741 n=1 Tax=Papaver somniferum TaxID=3469 RepID=UPI000E705CA7|nr:uncharacterized protein LOC113302741 [Papaver somniferum]